jgi:putative ATPase
MFQDTAPLAERMRPKSLSDIIGQGHLVGDQGNEVRVPFHVLSAISAGVKDVREVIAKVSPGQKNILFIDEIHRFNKSQQDALLGAVEKGKITLIGATTENPSFEVNAALLSRAQVYRLNPLTSEELNAIMMQAAQIIKPPRTSRDQSKIQ